ncbi:MAG: hypothetical protein BIFFINMI_01669 [Phycisphaerae bacterium]|nr:hypothetical protein [Phycisphaerae bacterium]
MSSIRPLALLTAALAAASAGCSQPTVRSQLAGQWRGAIVSTSTRPAEDKSLRVEDFSLTILPDGRIATVGLLPTGQARRAGQVLRDMGQSGLRVRVEQADYSPTASTVTLTFTGEVDGRSGPVRGGQTQSARLTADGRLDYRFFGYAMTVGDPRTSEAISHVGVLRRVEPTTQPDGD